MTPAPYRQIKPDFGYNFWGLRFLAGCLVVFPMGSLFLLLLQPFFGRYMLEAELEWDSYLEKAVSILWWRGPGKPGNISSESGGLKYNKSEHDGSRSKS